MSAINWARQVAQEFEFGRDDVRKATKHFIKQMGEFSRQAFRHVTDNYRGWFED